MDTSGFSDLALCQICPWDGGWVAAYNSDAETALWGRVMVQHGRRGDVVMQGSLVLAPKLPKPCFCSNLAHTNLVII